MRQLISEARTKYVSNCFQSAYIAWETNLLPLQKGITDETTKKKHSSEPQKHIEWKKKKSRCDTFAFSHTFTQLNPACNRSRKKTRQEREREREKVERNGNWEVVWWRSRIKRTTKVLIKSIWSKTLRQTCYHLGCK